MLGYKINVPPPQHIVSTSKTFPKPKLTAAQLDKRRETRAKAPRRRPVRARRLEQAAEPTGGRIALGFAAGFALGLIVLTFLLAPEAVRGQFIPVPALLGSVLVGLLCAGFFARD